MGASASAENFYDAVLPCNLSDLCGSKDREGEWRVEVRGGKDALDMKKLDGLTIGILGHYNRGKTWIMSRLAQYNLPGQGMTSRTEGLSFKWISTTGGESAKAASHPTTGGESGKTAGHHTYYHIVIDTAGLNSPMVFIGKDDKDEAKKIDLQEASLRTELYEDFLHSMTLQLSDFIIIVMNELTFQDQLFLHTVIDKWSALCKESNSKCKEVIVIHNFRFTKKAEERESLFRQSTNAVYEGRNFVDDRINYFRRVESNIGVRHVCLMLHEDKVGMNYNDAVFALLRKWITVLKLPDSGPRSLREIAKLIGHRATDLLRNRGFLSNVKEIETKVEEEGILRYRPIKEVPDRPVVVAKSRADRFYGGVGGFKPSALVATYKTKEGSSCKLVLLELPGVQKRHRVVRKVDHSSAKPGYCAIEVKGEKKEPEILKIIKEHLADDEKAFLPADDNYYDVADGAPDADECVYGAFRQIFHIPLKFKAKDPKVIRSDNGLVIFLFRSEGDGDDSDSPSSCD